MLELLVVADHPVDVVPEVRVDVDDLGLRRQPSVHQLLERLEEHLCTPKHLLHVPESTDRRTAPARGAARAGHCIRRPVVRRS